MTPAPFHNDLAEGPSGGAAYWVTAADGVRLRIGGWGAGAPKGTILLFPGRTEYIEKYGRNAQDFLGHGYATLAIDWRGQGLSDRLLEDRQKGHVGSFTDYQHDVAALIEHAEEMGFSAPYYLIAHSMGGCIGFRSLCQGLPVKAAAFSGPMWGIRMPTGVNTIAPIITGFFRSIGLDNSYIFTANSENYVQNVSFSENLLTTDEEMFAYMRNQIALQPPLGLGGPTFRWLGEALREIRYLHETKAPDIPCRCYLGTSEKIVDDKAMHRRMNTWPGGELIEVSLAEHEVLMEGPEIRHRLAEEICDFFGKHSR